MMLNLNNYAGAARTLVTQLLDVATYAVSEETVLLQANELSTILLPRGHRHSLRGWLTVTYELVDTAEIRPVVYVIQPRDTTWKLVGLVVADRLLWSATVPDGKTLNVPNDWNGEPADAYEY